MGVALTYRLTEQRLLEPCDLPSLREDAIEVEFTEQATVRLLHTRISDALESGPVIFAEMPVALVRRVVGIAAGLAEQTHYTGSWLLGVHLEGIADLPVFWSMERWFRRLQVPAGMHQYRATAMVSGVELTCSQGAVTTRLMGSYLRALALQNYAGMKPWTTDPG